MSLWKALSHPPFQVMLDAFLSIGHPHQPVTLPSVHSAGLGVSSLGFYLVLGFVLPGLTLVPDLDGTIRKSMASSLLCSCGVSLGAELPGMGRGL